MYKLCFYVPKSHLQAVKDAVFTAGGGKLGDYDSCCWQTLGQGQFRPLDGSDPHIGSVGEMTCVEEYRVETICQDAVVQAVIAALREAHPYEEPAYDVWSLAEF